MKENESENESSRGRADNMHPDIYDISLNNINLTC